MMKLPSVISVQYATRFLGGFFGASAGFVLVSIPVMSWASGRIDDQESVAENVDDKKKNAA